MNTTDNAKGARVTDALLNWESESPQMKSASWLESPTCN